MLLLTSRRDAAERLRLHAPDQIPFVTLSFSFVSFVEILDLPDAFTSA